tara:strand:- start:375 stop:806 length:432 start_codon:yes stop_codon:yes gene_type:complete
MPDLDQIVFRKWENEPDKTKLSSVSFETKVYEFAGPGNKFNFIELYVSFLKNPNYIIRVYYNTNKNSDVFTHLKTFSSNLDSPFRIRPSIHKKEKKQLSNISKIAFKFRIEVSSNSVVTDKDFAIDDIYIVYRNFRTLNIEED